MRILSNLFKGAVKFFTSPKKSSFRKKVFIIWLVIMPILAILVSFHAEYAADTVPIPATQLDVISEVNSIDNVKLFASNFVLGMLAGTETDSNNNTSSIKTTLMKFSSLSTTFSLPTDPYTVSQILAEKTNVRSYTNDKTKKQWQVFIKATLTSPGVVGYNSYHFAINIMESKGSYQVIALPRLVNSLSTPIEVVPEYDTNVSVDTALGHQVSNFLTAFYITNNTGSLGSFVTSDFKEQSITSSMCSAVDTQRIQKEKSNKVDIPSSKPGDKINLLVTAKCSSSSTTFLYMQIPIVVIKSPNNQWLINSIDIFENTGKIKNR